MLPGLEGEYMTAHKFKRPESVLVVVYTLNGSVLMLDRMRPKGFWQSVTGSLVECHQKRRFPIIRPWRSRYAPGVYYNTEHLFIFALATHRTIRLNPREHRQMRWLTKNQAAQKASSWTNREAILSWVP